MDVVPEEPVDQHVQDARTRNASDEHRETEVDHDVGVLSDPPRP